MGAYPASLSSWTSSSKTHKVLTKLRPYSNNIALAGLKGGRDGNSVLHEVQEEEGDRESKAGYAQESQTGHPGCMPRVRHEGIQNREALTVYSITQC